MRVRPALLAAACVVLAPSRATADVDSYVGKPVTSIRMHADGRPLPDSRLVPLVLTRPGQPLSMLEVRETITHLLSVGRFADVRVVAEAVPGGVSLLYELVPARTIDRIAFVGTSGLPGIDEGALRDVVVDRYGPAPPAGRAGELARVVEGQLARRGYLRAAVSARVEATGGPDRAVLTFAVTAGARTRIGQLRVQGSTNQTPAALLGRLGLSRGEAYEPDEIDGRAALYVNDRREEGLYNARLTVSPQVSDDARSADLTLEVDDGPRVRLVLAGDPLPPAQRDQLVPIAREGSTDEDLLEDSTNNIEEYLRALGYRDAVAPHSRDDVGGELHITFRVARGALYRVSRVDVSGNVLVPIGELAPLMGVREGEPFSQSALDADVAAIEALYQRRGFVAVDVKAGADPDARAGGGGEIPVVVRIIVSEQVRTTVGSVRFDGNRSIDEAVLRAGLGLQIGGPLFATQLAIDRDAIQLHYANLGFRNAVVGVDPGLSNDRTRADVVFTLREGPQLRVSHVLVTGNVRTSTDTIAREIQLQPGDPLGLDRVNETQRRLAALGLFRRVRLAEIRHGDDATRDLLVSVEEGPATTVGYGGGLEVGQRIRLTSDDTAEEVLEFSPRAFFDIGRRNLFGRNRSINLFTRVSLRPQQARTSSPPPGEGQSSEFGFLEYRVLATYREPRVFGTAADGILTATAEQQARSSFDFWRRAASADVGRRLTSRVSVSGNYTLERTEVFDNGISPEDKPIVDRLFSKVRLSSFSASVVRDTRDDPLNTGSGLYLSANAQLASPLIGSEVGLAKSYLTAQVFRSLPRTRQATVAASARLGLAAGFPLKDLPASERFFAGGDTTVRGFALDALGTPGETLDQNGLPIGGNAVVIFNLELRVPVAGGLAAVGFVDSGNVFQRTSDLDLGRLRSAIGFGIRYRSPVGPIRVDLGFKIHPQDIAPNNPERLTAVHISLGQAF